MKKKYGIGMSAAVGVISLLLAGCGAANDGNAVGTEATGAVAETTGSEETADTSAGFEVFLPTSYETSGDQRYPTLYLLPDDGIQAFSEELRSTIEAAIDGDDVMDMIVVCPALPDPTTEADANVHTAMREIVAEIDENYRTIPKAEARGVAGVETGGFLASVLTYTNDEDKLLLEPDLFGLSGSISGDYASGENPWLSVHGGFLTLAENGAMTNDLARQYYTYMTTASESPSSYAEGGANDIIAFFLKRGAAYDGSYYDLYGNADDTVLSLTIKNGEDTIEFRENAAIEMLVGFSRRMAKSELASELPAYEVIEEASEKIWEPWTIEDAIDLMGEWHFKAEKKVTAETLPEASDYQNWETVTPALGWWDSDFSTETDMKAFSGYAWYVKDFTVPSDFPKETLYLPVGYFDETDIVFVNGEMVGCTGLDAETWRHLDDCWDEERVYTVEPSVLNYGGENTIVVLTHNNSGDGGWYDGHPGLLTAASYEELTGTDPTDSGDTEREGEFFSVTIDSKYRASALRSREAAEPETFLIYLPVGYFDEANADKRYPTAYLFHQLNSTSNSYKIDGIDALMNEGIADGRLSELIVVAPDSNDDGFWVGDWEKMVVDEVLPFIDDHYRTLADEKHRFTAGASMGGSGAMNIALRHPELFSGYISYFGAINMGGNPLQTAINMDADEFSHFTQYFIAGNRDLYKFGLPAITLDQRLRKDKIAHFFELGEGGHDSVYYLPYVIDSFAYQLDAME